MKPSDLEKRRQSFDSATADEDEDFEEIIASSRSPASSSEKITLLPLSCLVEYTDEGLESLTGRPQPFRPYTKERLTSLAKSIRENGVINPIVVRPLSNDRYQILAGRNRTRACRLCGKTTVPAIIRSKVDDVGAAMIMLDTNLEQRPQLTYSEKAYAYKMRVELQKRQGHRTDLEGSGKQDSLKEAGRDNNDSRRTVAYLIRLTYLIPSILELVDEGKLGFRLGVTLSYLQQETQQQVYTQILLPGIRVKASQIKELRVLEEHGQITEDSLRSLFQKTAPPSFPAITIRGEALQKYAAILPDAKEVERLFLEFLQSYANNLVQPLHQVAQPEAQ